MCVWAVAWSEGKGSLWVDSLIGSPFYYYWIDNALTIFIRNIFLSLSSSLMIRPGKKRVNRLLCCVDFEYFFFHPFFSLKLGYFWIVSRRVSVCLCVLHYIGTNSCESSSLIINAGVSMCRLSLPRPNAIEEETVFFLSLLRFIRIFYFYEGYNFTIFG